MSQHQHQRSLPQQAAPPAPAVESPQPIVRVMRLYKPMMHLTPPVPQLRMPADLNVLSNNESNDNFALSNFLLLPDSFGDIYLGESFSAYVSVVNGTASTIFSSVQLSVKLQSNLATYDLEDRRPKHGVKIDNSCMLHPLQSLDTAVSHPISMMGTHSLKVFVEYVDPETGEQRTLKKFYKFTALNPLLVSCNTMDLGNRYVVQSQITNCTRSLLHIEKVSLLSHRDLVVTRTAAADDINDTCRFDSFPSLGPDEKYAESFMLEKPIGFMAASLGVVEVKWSTAMGEHGYVRSEELSAPTVNLGLNLVVSDGSVVVNPVHKNVVFSPPGKRSINSRPSSVSTNPVQPLLSFHCLSCPDTTISGQEFEIKVRIFNDNYSSPANVGLRCSNPCSCGEGSLGLLVVGKTSWSIGALAPRAFADISIHAVAMSSGLYEFGGLFVMDADTRKEYMSGSAIAKVFAYDSYPHVTDLEVT